MSTKSLRKLEQQGMKRSWALQQAGAQASCRVAARTKAGTLVNGAYGTGGHWRRAIATRPSRETAMPEARRRSAKALAEEEQPHMLETATASTFVGTIDETIYSYVLSMGVKETQAQRACREATAMMRDAHLQIPPDEGALLGWLVRAFEVRKAVEVGVFTGYSSLCIAEAMKSDGRLYACELNEEYAQIASSYWRDAGIQNRIDLRLGAAIESMERLYAEHGSSFDFVFIDADKKNYEIYYELALKMIRPGGLIAIDNTLLHGKVADVSIREKHVLTVRHLNRKISSDDRVNYSLLSVGDGLTLVQKKAHPADTQQARGSLDSWSKAELLGFLQQTLKRLDEVTMERDELQDYVRNLHTARIAETSAEDVGKHKHYVKTGSVVTVLTKQETDPHKKGVVKIILTNSSYHPNGIKVRLEDGSVGRVIAIHPHPTTLPIIPRHSACS